MATITFAGRLPAKNGVGTVGVTVYEADGETVAAARTTAGIVELPDGSGHYVATRTITGDKRLLYGQLDDGGSPARHTAPLLTANYDPIAVVEDIEDIADGGGGGGGALTDPDFEPVPTQRVYVLVESGSGLVGDAVRSSIIGEAVTWAVDFRNDKSINGVIITVEEPEIITGDSGGINFSNIGRYNTQAKFRMSGEVAGTYVIEVTAIYNSGIERKGRITHDIVA